MLLHLGVLDLPYGHQQAARRRKRRSTAGTKSTGDVAEILEAKYHVMEIFFEENADEIVSYLEASLTGAIDNVLLGAPISTSAFGYAESKIRDRFDQFISQREMDALGYPGIPTQAAQKGVSHRFKRARKTRSPRPSFIDTGLYLSSFRAWIDP